MPVPLSAFVTQCTSYPLNLAFRLSVGFCRIASQVRVVPVTFPLLCSVLLSSALIALHLRAYLHFSSMSSLRTAQIFDHTTKVLLKGKTGDVPVPPVSLGILRPGASPHRRNGDASISAQIALDDRDADAEYIFVCRLRAVLGLGVIA